jgi:hypothetical protein
MNVFGETSRCRTLILLALGLGIFGLSLIYAFACDRLYGGD